VCVRARVRISLSLSLYVYIHVYMYTCVRVRVRIYIYIYIYRQNALFVPLSNGAEVFLYGGWNGGELGDTHVLRLGAMGCAQSEELKCKDSSSAQG
jgi:hypothetical protein